ncbi:ABC transporter [Longimycelium tulufanense]|uniref:ABC transporter n=1 Tax=Longimycelium tulufanense TaxID=907463 RepID=A0A8J3FYC9_9PSEU|nr:ABC transporter [Longimycelium tulufanense]
MLVPLMYGSLYLYANWDPYKKLDEVPAALVVEDQGVAKDGKEMHAGEDVANELLDAKKFDWHRTDRTDAEDGVRHGRYTFSLTFPADFSDALMSSSDFKPRQGTIILTTNDSNNYLAGTIANKVVDEIHRAVSSKVGRQAADRFLLGFATIAEKMRQATDGATKLANGSATLDSNARELLNGQRKLLDGTTKLTNDVPKLADGAKKVSNGLGELGNQTKDMPGQTRQLADGADRLTEKSQELSKGAQRVAEGNAQFADKVNDANAKLRKYHDLITNNELNQLLHRTCRENPGAPGCDLLDRIDTKYQEAQVAVGKVNELADGAKKVADGTAQLSGGAGQLADGTKKLATKAPELVNGIEQLQGGAQQVADGSGRLAAKAPELRDGVQRAVDGTQRMVNEGTGKLKDGSRELADQLGAGRDQVPNPDDPTRKATAETIGDPVAINKLSQAGAGTYGAGLAPFFLGLSLWIGGFVLFLLLKPLSARALAAGQPALRVALGGWLPAALLGAVQVAVLYLVVTTTLDLDPAHPLATFGFLVLASLAFTAVLHGLNAYLGSVGKFAALVLLVLQLTSAGGTFPWQTTPAPLHPIHWALPLSYVVDGLRHLIYGGSLTDMGKDVAVIGAYLVAGLALSTFAARRQKVWTPKQLKPELVL